jgi:predicted SprT family Zn-dependent metalloprotease
MTTHDAQQLAHDLLTQHGLYARGWRFKYDNAVRRFGKCSFRTRTITISRKLTLLNDIDAVRDTLLHEIAHALVGHGHGHDAVWRAQALAIGCDGRRTYSNATVRTIPRAFIGTCNNCRRTITRHRRNAIACGTCCRMHNNGRYDDAYLFTWQRNPDALTTQYI